MKKKKAFHIGYFSILAVLNVVCMIVVYKYYVVSDIPQRLIVSVSFDLSKYLSIIIIEIMLALFLIVEIVFIIVSCKNKDTKIAKIIIPIAFVFVVPFSISIPLMTTETAQLSPKSTQIEIPFDELTNCGTSVDTYSTYDKNGLGKVAYYAKNCYFEKKGDNTPTSNNSSAEFLCSFQQSDLEFINNKFERYDTENYALKNKETSKNYTLYYEADSEHISYALIVENGNKYFVSTFESIDNNDFDSYGKDDFVADSLEVYNLCDKI